MNGLVQGSLFIAMVLVSTELPRTILARFQEGWTLAYRINDEGDDERPARKPAAQKTAKSREVQKQRRDVPTKVDRATLKDARPRATLVGHHSRVWDLAFSPDGKSLASSGDGEEPVRLWDVSTGKGRELFRPGLSGGYPVHIAFAPDGKTLGSGGNDLKQYERRDGQHRIIVRLWDTRSGKDRFVVVSNDDNPDIQSLAYSPDGSTLVVNNRTRLYLWDVIKETSRAYVEIPADTRFSNVNTVCTRAVISPDGGTLATSTTDRQVRLWDASTGRPLARFQAHSGGVLVVAFSKDGGRLVSGGVDRTVRIWPVAEIAGRKSPVKPEKILQQQSAIYDLALSADGSLLAAAGFDGVVTIYDAKTWELRTSFDTGQKDCVLCAFSPDGSTLATSGALPEIRLWDLAALLDATPR